MADVSDADAASTAAPTETFVPAVSFLGYPDGSTEVHFVAGVESAPVTAEFATLMRAKVWWPTAKPPTRLRRTKAAAVSRVAGVVGRPPPIQSALRIAIGPANDIAKRSALGECIARDDADFAARAGFFYLGLPVIIPASEAL